MQFRFSLVMFYFFITHFLKVTSAMGWKSKVHIFKSILHLTWLARIDFYCDMNYQYVRPRSKKWGQNLN